MSTPPRRPKRQTESALTKAIIRELHVHKKRGIALWWFKVHGGPMQRAGVPDLYVCCLGISYWLEIKTPHKSGQKTLDGGEIGSGGGELSKIQEHTIEQMRAAGCNVQVVRSVEEAMEAICPL